MQEIDAVVRAIVAATDSAPEDASWVSWPSPILCAIDCLLSLDPRDRGWVEEHVRRLQSPDPYYGTLETVGWCAAHFPSMENFFRFELKDETARRAELFLPLVNALIDLKRGFPGATEGERLRAWAAVASPMESSVGAFRGLGVIGFQRLRRLLGADAAIPTEAMAAFVGRTVGRPVEMAEAAFLLERAAGRLGYDPESIPYDG